MDRSDATTERSRLLAYGAAAAVLTVLGVLLRFLPVIQTSFPFGDGGLYYAYVRDVSANGLIPPSHTTYNGGIEFPYPFLAFQLVDVLSTVTGQSQLAVMQYLPAFLSTLGIAAFALLALVEIRRPGPAFLATLLFATIPEVYANSILGGGITKALVTDFVLLALAAGAIACRSGRFSHWILAGVLVGLAQLSHPSGGVVGGLGLLFLVLIEGPTLTRLRAFVLCGLVALTIAAAWWLPVLLRDGPGTFLAAAGGGRSLLIAVLRQPVVIMLDGGSPIFGIAFLLAAMQTIVKRDRTLFLMLAWFEAVSIVDERNAYMSAPVPFALFASLGSWSYVEGVARALPEKIRPGLDTFRVPAAAFLVVLTVVSFAVPLVTPGITGPRDPLREPDLAAIRAAGATLPPRSRVLIVTGARWAHDDIGEWFPALTPDIAVMTPQGTEWQPNDTFDRLADEHDALQECASQTIACVEAWGGANDVAFDAIYVAGVDSEPSREPEPTVAQLLGLQSRSTSDCCAPLRASLAFNPSWRVVYSGPGALIAVRSSSS